MERTSSHYKLGNSIRTRQSPLAVFLHSLKLELEKHLVLHNVADCDFTHSCTTIDLVDASDRTRNLALIQ